MKTKSIINNEKLIELFAQLIPAITHNTNGCCKYLMSNSVMSFSFPAASITPSWLQLVSRTIPP
jgi:hypothetical protein